MWGRPSGRPFFARKMMQCGTSFFTKMPHRFVRVKGFLLGVVKEGKNWATIRQIATIGLTASSGRGPGSPNGELKADGRSRVWGSDFSSGWRGGSRLPCHRSCGASVADASGHKLGLGTNRRTSCHFRRGADDRGILQRLSGACRVPGRSALQPHPFPFAFHHRCSSDRHRPGRGRADHGDTLRRSRGHPDRTGDRLSLQPGAAGRPDAAAGRGRRADQPRADICGACLSDLASHACGLPHSPAAARLAPANRQLQRLGQPSHV